MKDGLFADQPDLQTLQERVDAHYDSYFAPSTWQSFRKWVAATQDKKDSVSVKGLRQKSVVAATAVTPAVVSQAMAELQQILLETGIARKEGEEVVVQAAEAHRLATCDEKGLSQRSDEVSKGIIPHDLRKRAVSTAPALSFTHITILSFLPLTLPAAVNGRHLPVGVIVPFTKTNDAMQAAWPAAKIRANSSGSITAALFAELVEECYLLPMRRLEPEKVPRMHDLKVCRCLL